MNLAIDYGFSSEAIWILYNIQHKFENNELIIHCPTKEDMFFILKISDYLGIKYHSDIINLWHGFKEESCLHYTSDHGRLYCDRTSYLQYAYSKYEILEYNFGNLDENVISIIDKIIRR